MCPQQTVGECLYHTPEDKYGIPKRGWEEGSQASALVSPPPCLAQVTRGPNIWQKDHPEGSSTESGTRPVAAPRCGFTHQSSTSS